jgi:hypothetical protein
MYKPCNAHMCDNKTCFSDVGILTTSFRQNRYKLFSRVVFLFHNVIKMHKQAFFALKCKYLKYIENLRPKIFFKSIFDKFCCKTKEFSSANFLFESKGSFNQGFKLYF